MIGLVTTIAGTLSNLALAMFEKPEPMTPGYDPAKLRPNPKPVL